MTSRPPKPRPTRLLPALAAAGVLAACGGANEPAADRHDHGHDHAHLETAGRLAVADAGQPTLRLFDLDAQPPLAHAFMLDDVPSALYASPGDRYVLAYQPDRVQFVDGGIFQEPHGDHDDDRKIDPGLVPWRLTGTRPAHYDLQAGLQAAVFMDGSASETPVQPASVQIVTDGSIAAGQVRASLDYAEPLHGLAEPVGDFLFAASRAADAPDALPTHLEQFRRDGAAYAAVRQVPTRCNSMHGSFAAQRFIVAGCEDGVLAVALDDDGSFTDRKITTPLRVGTIAGHPASGAQFVAIANEGSPPNQTTRFFAVDAIAGTAAPLLPQGWRDGRVRRAHVFDRSGERLFVLDDEGTLYVLQRSGSAWSTAARLPGTIPEMPPAAPWPALAASGARDEIYLSDPQAQRIRVLDAISGTQRSEFGLGYTPSALAWVGIRRH